MRLALIVAALGSLALVTAPAHASVSHTFTKTFGSATTTPVDPYPISEPTDVAVDQASHDVYVTDPPNHRIEKFDSEGHFILMFGKGVDKITGKDVCTAASGNVCQPGASSGSSGGFETPMYLAVDNYPGGEGDIYVADTGDNFVSKFDSSGHILPSWGVSGQKDGSDSSKLPIFGPIFSLAVGGGCATPSNPLTGVCHPNGTLYVGGLHYSYNVWVYTQSGEFIVNSFQRELPQLKVDAEGNYYWPETPFSEFFSGNKKVYKGVPNQGSQGELTEYEMTTDRPTTGFALDPSSNELYQVVAPLNVEGETHGIRVDHYSGDCNPVNGPCEPLDTFGEGDLTPATEVNIPRANNPNFVKGVAVDGTTHAVYVVDSESGGGNVALFSDVRPIVTTGQPTELTTSSVTLTGNIDPAGRGDIGECRFEYGADDTYGHSIPCSPDPTSGNFTGPTDVTATLTGLSPGTHEHYRLVAGNIAGGSSNGLDETFTTTAPPAIDGLSSENLTATSADLIAQVNPNGLTTRYRFEYGTTTLYGHLAPTPDGTIEASSSDQTIEVHLAGLEPHAVYHFRLVADNRVEGKEEGGVTTTEDHTFNFFPPSCPNENVRQQAQANYLPDCRAYELVSPSDANGTQLYPGGPNTGQATNPSRFSYTGLWSTIPNSGGEPIDGTGDLYVASRTDTGWVTKYIGPPASQVAVAGGPPRGLYGQGGPQFLGNRTSISAGGFGADIIQNNVLTDPAMNTFLDWNDGNNEEHGPNPTPIASNAAYVWGADGHFVDRWPTNLATVPVGLNSTLEGGNNPGGMRALDCPEVHNNAFFNDLVANNCPGEVSASANLEHYVFSSEWNVFAPGGQLAPPGSVYDNDTTHGSTVVASKTPAGEDIPSEPGDHAGDPLEIPGVSSDGSRIVIASSGVGPCGLTNCPTPPCGDTFGGVIHCPTYPGHLYLRVNQAVTYDVSQGHDVAYVGMTSDASKIYFTSAERLNGEDQDGSVDLYMWSEAGEEEGKPLTLISKGNNPGNQGEPGNSDACKGGLPAEDGALNNGGLTTNCGVLTFSNLSYCQLAGGEGGNCRSDNSIASKNGDIYFFSPEQLDGSRGIPDKENLYDYRGGQVQFVATLQPEQFCFHSPIPGFSDEACSSSAVARMQVSPDDSHMAFVTASPVTQYDNAKHLELYMYDPSTRRVVCASCIPSGEPPAHDVGASQDGLFMTDDGRAFFSTDDALVHGDTNHAIDVYEYVDGHPQLITTGTGETSVAGGIASALLNPPGLSGVSADGRDVYFSTYDTLVSQDHNGLFLKFYDARAGGGFPALPPPPPCEAADECHGAGSVPPAAIKNETGTVLAGGNATESHRKHRRNHRHRRAHRGKRGRR